MAEKSKTSSSSTQDDSVSRPDVPIHKPRDSLLSHSSGFNNYRGFLNLCIVLLGMSTSRLVLENLIKYGIIMDPIMWVSIFLQDPYSWPNLTLLIILNGFILYAFWLEKLISKKAINERTMTVLVTLNVMTVFVFPVVVIVYYKPNPVGSFVSLGTYSIVFLKLISYAAVNKWCRDAQSSVSRKTKKNITNGDSSLSRNSPRRHSTPQPRKRVSNRRISEGSNLDANGEQTEQLVEYPDNLTLHDMCYFMMVPTLCYELNFPRTKRIRKRFLIRRAIELVFLVQLCLCLVQQWIVPTVLNALAPFTSLDTKRMLERVLKLAVPNHICWLIFFYSFFHSWLNVLGEVTKFADRNFYQDWWNAETIAYFWKNWNIPVHKWCLRHIYIPLRSKGIDQQKAQMIVFLVSAIFHEYLVSIPLQMFRLWAFWGMMAQLPLAKLTSNVKGHWGNILVWLSLIIGQPVALLMYFHDYYVMHAATNLNSTSTTP
ncbi:diacylglycerol O-acyltransferase 1-like [Lytechinus pictus]|uniref:diacylglycerol O-acyltransferase 1-like n=1 Tax=Lytechinus pictus TaxID=7653 RepID=UPI00240E4AE8|nr:diacylglycerol O-acyltransferase 1-like [Lytechinus pictus]